MRYLVKKIRLRLSKNRHAQAITDLSSLNNKPFFTNKNPKYACYNIGDWTYGNPIIKSWDEKTELKIGKFCSIAGNVQILLGGEHRKDWVTTYPFTEFFEEAKGIGGHPHTKGSITIGNDVWICQNAIILSGVTIGNGVVVGAGTVITRDIPAYAIAAGNPAKIIGYRFTDEQIYKLETIAWWNWDIERIKTQLPMLLSSRIDEFIEENYKS